MKKILLLSFTLSSFVYSYSQVTDTVSLSTGYANQVWYSLQNDNQGSAPKNNWDLAFDCSGFGSAVHINSITGTMVWLYPNTDTSGWNTLDTAGITTWKAYYNSDTSWSVGAFDRGMDLANSFDLGWGIYNSTTHVVTGDSLFVIKLASGAYKKICIQTLASGFYNFKYADLNGANLQTVALNKALYTGKNFAYYSLQNDMALDREPASANWDLLFTQYTTFIPTPYTVAGVLHNTGVEVAQVHPVNDPSTYTNWSAHGFNHYINEIGYDWKNFTGVWDIEDSLVYFVKTNAGDVWKMVYTGFGGSGNGNYIFTKQMISASGVTNEISPVSTVTMYPNPASEFTQVVYHVNNSVSSATMMVHDLSGKQISTQLLNTQPGLHTTMLNTENFSSGMYVVTLLFDNTRVQQKLTVY